MKNISPPTLMLACVLGMIVLNWLLPLGWISSWVLLSLGVAFIALGLVLGFGAEGQFRRTGTTVDPLGRATTLVTDGWFKYSRNPMYLSFALMLVGAWLTLGSASPLLSLLAYFFLTERWYILPEEERLAAAFGKQYQSYQRRTRRWL